MSTALLDENGTLSGVLAAVDAALDEALSTELWPAGDTGLASAVAVSARLVNRANALLVRLVGEIDDRGLAARQGATSSAAWTRHQLTFTPREARAAVDVATATRTGLGGLRVAFEAGDVSLAQAAVIAAAVDDLPDDVPAETRTRAETTLVGYAARFDALQLTRLGQRILTVVAPDIGEARDAEALDRQERRARQRREFTLTPDGHGTVHLFGRLTDEAAAIVRAALDPLAAPLPRTDEGPDPRSAAQRRADALEELCRRALAGRPTEATEAARPAGRPATQVMVTIPLRLLTDGLGTATLPDGAPLSPGAARRMACDADLIPAVLGTASAVLDVGRSQRLFTSARRRALIVRDRGCGFPGCDRPPEWCEGHHILGFAHGGRTEPRNGVLLCGHHHHVVHDDGWDIVITDDGIPEFIPPPWVDPTRTPRRNDRYG